MKTPLEKINAQQLQVSLAPLRDAERLKARWLGLELNADRSFFQSWAWIGSWLAGLSSPPYLAEISTPDGDDIALGLFCEHTEARNKLIKARQLILHATGQEALDAITIEHNDLLCIRGFHQQAWQALTHHLKQAETPTWDEIIIPGATSLQESVTIGMLPNSYRRAHAGSSFVDLSKLRRQGVHDRDGYIAILSKNTRSQIRRSLKLYAECGPIALERATTLDDAYTFFDAMGTLHEAKWQKRGRSSVISNPHYLAFQQRLIEQGLPIGQVELLRARAGDHIFGWLYNFKDRGNVLFYCSGFAAETDNRLKPGLVTHVLAIEDHLKSGQSTYDFMGGDDRYKKSLGQPGLDIVSYSLQKATPMLVVENYARTLKNQFKQN